MRELELNILCRRRSTIEPANPYNVLGIFSGHAHKSFHINVPVGKDADGNDVHFNNYVMDDTYGGNGDYGFSIVTLTGSELRIHSKEVGTNSWDYYSKPIKVY